MASPTESLVQVTEGSGKKLHTMNRTIGANDVHDEVMIFGEPGLPTYVTTTPTGGIATTTANSHVVQLMCGASLNNYIRRIEVWQMTLATTATLMEWQLWTLTTAGTGGTSLTNFRMDAGNDAAAGSAGMTLPTVKGTESLRVWTGSFNSVQTIGAGAGQNLRMFDIDFDKLLRMKGLRIAAGTANGIALKNVTASGGGCAVAVSVYWGEANF